jgi:uncharacterized membrane protein
MKKLFKFFGFTANNGQNASARKLTAFAFVVMAAFMHWKHGQSDPVSFLIADCVVILVALGIVTAEQIITLWKDKDSKPEPSEIEK